MSLTVTIRPAAVEALTCPTVKDALADGRDTYHGRLVTFTEANVIRAVADDADRAASNLEEEGKGGTARGLRNLRDKCLTALDNPTVTEETATTLDDGRHLEVGDEFSVKGVGRFRLKKIRDNGELNAWGPIESGGTIPNGGMRSFRPDSVSTVHTKKRAQDAVRQEAS
jgi:hypothetical protein